MRKQKETPQDKLKKELKRVKSELYSFVKKANANPDGFEARAKEVMVKKYNNQIADCQKRLAQYSN